jgi:aldose sugar dehydrogenase
LGKEYQNNMFVGDINNGLLYRFILNEARDRLSFDNGYSGNTALLADREVTDPKGNQPVVFGQGFGGITDIEVDPDRYLYILSYTGSLFRIVPSSISATTNFDVNTTTINDQQPQQVDNNDQNNSPDANSIPAVILGINGDNSYSPNPITIEEGQTITWYNGDTISHTVTSGQDNDDDAGEAFDSDSIISNQYYNIIFEDSGDYHYYCHYHPSMVGEIIVE